MNMYDFEVKHTNADAFNVHEKQISLASYIDGLTISNPNLYIHCSSPSVVGDI